MFLEKIEVIGFKSFAEKTALRFDKGMTAIVGPNGSGKSNLAESVRWVLGEQSMKLLRGKKSEDVIFAGTDKKARLGMAEVSLFLNNEDGKAPIDYDQVVLTRRVFRDGASDYLINKNKVRLLDIQELLAKCGFGQKTYSVIGQGMIDSFLRATPRERKELFEEAAGTKQFELKRNLSIIKLSQTKQNLLRVKDHLDELLPHLRSLKRQAGRARRKEDIEKELRGMQLEYFNNGWNNIISNQKNAGSTIEEIKNKEKETENNLKETEKTLMTAIAGGKTSADFDDQKNLNQYYNERNKIQEKLIIIKGTIQIEKERSISFDAKNLLAQKNNRENEIKAILADLERIRKTITDFEKEQKEKLFTYQKIIQKIKDFQNQVLPKTAEKNELVEIEKEVLELYQAEERLIKRLEDAKNINEIRAISLLAKEYLTRLWQVLEKIRKERRKGSREEKQEIQKIQEEIAKLISTKELQEKEINSQKIKLAILETKRDAYQDQVSQREKEKNELEKQIAKAGSADQAQSFEEYEKEKRELEAILEKISREIKISEEKLKARQTQEEESRKKIIDFENNYKTGQNLLNNIKDQLRAAQINIAKIENNKALLFDEIRDDFGEVRARELCEEFLKNPKKLDKTKTDSLHEEIERLKRQFIQVGEIDPQVIRECEEIEKRYNFLTSQKEDLEKATESLKGIIKELDEKIAASFDSAIKNINEHFQKYFTILFGGGKARLLKKKYEIEKEESEAAAAEEAVRAGVFEYKKQDEFYIDIKVTPPGKRLQDINMLSGGERALTSIALILAIITHNPSPFIVIDEVDAALDEANSARFSRIVREVSQKTQFIAITHNRETMRQAKILYGVTMEESGVSKLLSVDLEKIGKE